MEDKLVIMSNKSRVYSNEGLNRSGVVAKYIVPTPTFCHQVSKAKGFGPRKPLHGSVTIRDAYAP